jgi:amino acid transporter
VSWSLSRLRRLPWIAIVLTLLIGVTAIVPLDPIRNAVNGGPVPDARLERSVGYWMLGPISSMFDAMTLFSVGQIIGFTLWAFGLYILARLIRRLDRPVTLWRELAYAASALAILLLTYAAAILLPRPMARLIVNRAEVISIDFHTHTRYSHDGRPGWSAADVRDWHTAGGYDVAYITDHRTYDGATEGLALASSLVGEGSATTLLPGLEAFFHGEHVNILNAGLRYRGLTGADFVEVSDTALAYSSMFAGVEPILIETIPGNLDMIIPATGPRSAGVRAIELVAGSPRGMSQTKRDHDRIVTLADSLNLALVAGSDNHGWGRTAPGWTLLKIPGLWRSYRPDSLANMIDEVIRVAGRRATFVAERTTAGASPAELAFALPTVVWTVTRTLSSPERVAWLFWIWVPWAIVQIMRRRRAASAR